MGETNIANEIQDGRTHSCTPELQAKFIEMVEKGVPLTIACKGVGIAYPTYNRWTHYAKQGREPFYGFVIAVQRARADGVTRRLERIESAGKSGKWQADAWYLERVHSEEFAIKTKLEATVRDGRTHLDLSQLADDELAVLEKALASEQSTRDTPDDDKTLELSTSVSSANGTGES